MRKSSPTAPKVHFIGIGGIGTSALARWFLYHGYKVSGWDTPSSLISYTVHGLDKEGVKISITSKPMPIPRDAKLVIYNVAHRDNPQLKKAQSMGIPVKSYAEALGDVARKYKTIAIAGAHGKSTSTALLSLALIKSGFDPTVIVGTKLKEFGNRNFRNGKGRYLILEADEYHKSFLNYSPSAAMITNIDKEHLDFYKNLSEIKRVFLRFIGSIKPRGILVLNKDDHNLFSLKDKIGKIAKKNHLRVFWYGARVNPGLARRVQRSLKISGDHNISNSLGVYTLAKELGAKDKDIFKALTSYCGAWRRMEYKGKFKIQKSNIKIDVYDDYAHHPTEVRAALSGIAQRWPSSALICVFQPHQAQRLKLLFKEFITAFDDADILILLDIYKVVGRDGMSHNIDSSKLAQAISAHLRQAKNRKKMSRAGFIRLKEVIYVPYSANVVNRLKSILSRPNIIQRESAFGLSQSAIMVMMGAGDIVNHTSSLLK